MEIQFIKGIFSVIAAIITHIVCIYIYILTVYDSC